uniref:TEA domain transcription factor 3 n=1 Tax=Sus scrofa TaxID=9823 RepID=A0A5G2QJ33_PIG
HKEKSTDVHSQGHHTQGCRLCTAQTPGRRVKIQPAFLSSRGAVFPTRPEALQLRAPGPAPLSCCLRARVAGPHHRLLQAAAPRVFRLHGGAARPRHVPGPAPRARARLTLSWALPTVQQTPVCAHRPDNPAFSDPPLEAVDVRQIYDKFPEKKGGLKELYEKGPPNAFFLVKFWADLNSTIQEGPGAFYGVSSQYSSAESMTISVSTKVCSFGKQVVEKVETEYARLENGRFVYRIHRSPMCEYMINFIHKLKHLPEKYMMNSVLENFTILQVVTSRDSQETLLVIAFVFEVSTSEHGAQHHVYKLVKD